MSSFKESSSVFVNAHRLIPEEWDFTNFTDGWQGFGGITFTTFFLRTPLSSQLFRLWVASFPRPLLPTASPESNLQGKKIWFVLMMLTMMLPYEMVMIPQYVMFAGFGWIDTYLPLILPTFFLECRFSFFSLCNLLEQSRPNWIKQLELTAAIRFRFFFGSLCH